MIFHDRRSGTLHDISALSGVGAPAGPGGGIVGRLNTASAVQSGQAAAFGPRKVVRTPAFTRPSVAPGLPTARTIVPGTSKPTVGRRAMRSMIAMPRMR